MAVDARTMTLDVRLEVDDFELEDLREALDEAEAANHSVSRVMMRDAQWRSLIARAGERYGVPDLLTVFGHDIVIEEDGLTPRQRSVKRIEAEFDRTRKQQVEDFLEAEAELADEGTFIPAALARYGTPAASVGAVDSARRR